MKIKMKYIKLMWAAILITITGFILNYNINTFDQDVNVKLIRKYLPFRTHKGQTYYGGDYNMIVQHPQYGYSDFRVDITTFENHQPGDQLIFSWNQRELENKFPNYPDRPWYYHLDTIMILSFCLCVLGVILPGLLIRSDQ